MTTQRDCLDCDGRLSAERIAERQNPDGSVTAWYLCGCCSKITKVVGEFLAGVHRRDFAL